MNDAGFGKYAQYVIYGPKPDQPTPSLPPGSVTDMAYLDGEVVPGAWNVITAWFWPRTTELLVIPDAHVHDEHEVVCFFGTDPNDPFDLCGQVEFWMEDTRMVLRNSCLIYVPARMRHAPLRLLRIDRPVFHFSSVTEFTWVRRPVS
jgi:hypothetical protein